MYLVPTAIDHRRLDGGIPTVLSFIRPIWMLKPPVWEPTVGRGLLIAPRRLHEEMRLLVFVFRGPDDPAYLNRVYVYTPVRVQQPVQPVPQPVQQPRRLVVDCNLGQRKAVAPYLRVMLRYIGIRAYLLGCQ
jgi:hypothetical protein